MWTCHLVTEKRGCYGWMDGVWSWTPVDGLEASDRGGVRRLGKSINTISSRVESGPMDGGKVVFFWRGGGFGMADIHGIK